MKKLVLGLILLMYGGPGHADSTSIETATAAAADFLALVDERQYAKSYSTASTILREEVSQEDWVTHVTSLRDPLGQVNERSISSSEFHESLPEAPAGEYVIITYDSSYENNKFAAEVVAVAKGNDGVWRVVGYYFG